MEPCSELFDTHSYFHSVVVTCSLDGEVGFFFRSWRYTVPRALSVIELLATLVQALLLTER
jgi:hypothetical protein